MRPAHGDDLGHNRQGDLIRGLGVNIQPNGRVDALDQLFADPARSPWDFLDAAGRDDQTYVDAAKACYAEPGACDYETGCRTRDIWSRINHSVEQALEQIPISSMLPQSKADDLLTLSD